MPEAEGSFIINSKIDTSGVTAGVEEIKSSMKNAAKAVSGYNAEAVKFVNEFAKSVGNGSKKANGMAKALEDAESEIKRLEGAGKGFGNAEYDDAYAKLQEIRRAVSLYKKELSAPLGDGGLKALGIDAEISNPKIAELTQRLQQLKARQNELSAAGLGLGFKEFDENAQEITKTEAALKRYQQELIGADTKTRKLNTTTKKGKSAFSGFGANLKKMGQTMKQGIKTLLMYGIGFRTLFALFNKLRNAVKEGLGNLAQYDSATNAALSSVKSSLTQLKNSLATAFSPIIQYVAPILTRFIDLLVNAANAVGMFFASITGKSTIVRATKVQENYAESLASTGSAAKEANKYLSGLDEIQTFQSQKDSGGSGGSGGGISPSSMFETVDVEGPVADFAKSIRDKIEAGDWRGIGTAVADKLNGAISSVNWNEFGSKIGTKINNAFETVGGFLEKFDFKNAGKALGESLNGLLNAIDWEHVGKGLSDGFTGALNFLNGALEAFDFKGLGNKFGDLVNGIDWAKSISTLGTTVANLAKGILDSISGALEGINWRELTNELWNGLIGFIKNVDIGSLLSSFYELFGALVGGLAAAAVGLAEGIWGTIKDAWASVVKWWKDTAFEDGKFTIQGLLDGIVEIFKNIGKWIKEHVFQPFIEGFKHAFKIGSPSKVMEEQGGFITEGLFGGITNGWKKITTFFSDAVKKIKTTLSTAWTNIKTTASTKWASIKTTVTTAWGKIKTGLSPSTIKTNLSNAWSSIKSTASTKWANIKTTVTTAWGKIKTNIKPNTISSTLSNAWSSIKSTASTKWSGIRTMLTGAWDRIKEKAVGRFTLIKDKIVGIWESLKNTIKSPINGLIGFLNRMISGLVGAINGVIDVLNRISVNVPYWVPELGGKHFGFAISHIYGSYIPYLASGAVIPPNAPFTAVLGDQRNGTNLETPEKLLRQIVREESSRASYQFVAQINRKTLFDEFIAEAKLRRTMTGRNPLTAI